MSAIFDDHPDLVGGLILVGLSAWGETVTVW